MKRALGLLYGVLCYLFFLAVFLRAIWYVWTMDALPAKSSMGQAEVKEAVLEGILEKQKSGKGRQLFKRAWTKLVQPPVERSTYVLVASATLLAVVVFWQPMPQTVWSVASQPWVLLLQALFWLGWLLLLTSTFLINHFDLFGLQQVWRYSRNLPYEAPKFVTPGPYRLVRHPLYLGFLVAFWSAP